MHQEMEHVRFPKKHFFKMRSQIIEERTRALQSNSEIFHIFYRFHECTVQFLI